MKRILLELALGLMAAVVWAVLIFVTLAPPACSTDTECGCLDYCLDPAYLQPIILKDMT